MHRPIAVHMSYLSSDMQPCSKAMYVHTHTHTHTHRHTHTHTHTHTHGPHSSADVLRHAATPTAILLLTL